MHESITPSRARRPKYGDRPSEFDPFEYHEKSHEKNRGEHTYESRAMRRGEPLQQASVRRREGHILTAGHDARKKDDELFSPALIELMIVQNKTETQGCQVKRWIQ